MIKIIVDHVIPFVDKFVHPSIEISRMSAQDITRKNLMTADAVLVRSVTRVDESLLRQTPVKFVGTLTAGYDHLDLAWLQNQQIHWASAPGANAKAVAQYVIACVAFFQKQAVLKQKIRAGIIGMGHVGQQLAHLWQALGVDLLVNDPPRAEKEADFFSVPLTEFNDLDVISLHASLNPSSFHLIDKKFLSRQKNNCVLINAGRGPVVNTSDLLDAQHIVACLDVYEYEPKIDKTLLAKARITTPHIAGYTWDAKYQATKMIFDAVIRFFGLPAVPLFEAFPQQQLSLADAQTWQDVVLSIYNPDVDSQRLKQYASEFEALRSHYELRREFAAYCVDAPLLSAADKNLLAKLGFQFRH